MDKVTEYLLGWTKLYIENQDIIKKAIKGIAQKDGRLEVDYKTKLQIFFIDPFLEDIDEEVGEMEKDKSYSIVCLNNPDNIKRMLMKWTQLIKLPLLNIYFVNPFSELDKRWIIYPFTHHRIADEESLETGLKSIAENVEPITREDVERKV